MAESINLLQSLVLQVVLSKIVYILTNRIGKLHHYVRVIGLGDSPNNKPELW